MRRIRPGNRLLSLSLLPSPSPQHSSAPFMSKPHEWVPASSNGHEHAVGGIELAVAGLAPAFDVAARLKAAGVMPPGRDRKERCAAGNEIFGAPPVAPAFDAVVRRQAARVSPGRW